MTKLFVLTAIMLTVALMPMLSLADEQSEAKRAPAATPAADNVVDKAVSSVGETVAEAVAAPVIKPAASFENVKDGDTVTSPVHLKFNVVGMEVAPAGTPTANTGHFHLLIDTELTPEQMKSPIPADDQHKHYGKGQTEDDVTLTPGKHTLQLVMGDGSHKPHNPPVMSDKITVTVK